MKKSKLVIIITLLAFSSLNAKDLIPSGNFDFDKLIKDIYNIYDSDEVHVKKERMVYKKLNDLINQTLTFRFTCSDSIAYDKREDKTTVKSQEVYYSDNKAGYFGIFAVVMKKGDDLLMSSAPEKEISVTGKIYDILVLSYKNKEGLYPKCRTSLKDFDDNGTEIQQIMIMIEA